MKQANTNTKTTVGRTIRNTLAPVFGPVFGKAARRFAAAFLGGLVTVAPVWADDTEIFFGDTTAGGVAPNLLLIVDTSGSMNNTVSGTGKTRMQNVQDALHVLLNSLNNVNVGLMRFSNPGGPVLYQIDYLDRNVNEVTGIVDVVSTVASGTDDAQQVVGAASYASLKDIFDVLTGQMILDADRLDITRAVVGSADVYTREVQDFSDDAEEEVGGSGDNVLRGNNDLEMTHDDGNASELHVVGVRFAGTLVPAGATITNAYVTFKVDNVGAGGTAEITITGETGASARFADLNNDISNRTRTASSVEWDLSNPAGNSIVNTPSLTAVVQDIVNDPAWKGDGTNVSDMTFIFERRAGSTAVAEHDFQAYDRGDFIPTLTVEYYVGSPPTEKETVTGLRFTNMDVPKGVTITGAYLDFTVAQTDSTDTTNLVIAGELSGNPTTYSNSDKISTRSRTTALVGWKDLEPWTTTGETKTSPDLKDIVQEIVNQADWCGGNPMAFMIAGEGLRSAWAKDADNGLQPVLRVSYDSDTIVPGSSCSVATMSMQITDSDDDVEEDGSDVWTSSDDLDFQSSSRHVGLRFPNINLPKDTTVLEAWIEFVAKNNYSGSTTVKIEAEQTDDAAEFTGSNGTVDSRTWGTALDWTISENWVDVQTHRTSDISSLVQTTVNRAGWSLGNAMAFRLYKSGGTTRAADSFNRDPVRAPRLVVRYQDDGTAAADVRLVREEILEQVDQLNTAGYTPIQDTMYEAALYYTGGAVDYGTYRGGPNDGGPHRYTRVSVNGSLVAGTYTNNYPTGCDADNLGANACRYETLAAGGGGGTPTYKTPIVDWCQKESHIILLTDGQANRPHSESKIKTFIDSNTCDTAGANSSEVCVKELANYLYTQDQSDLKEKQIVRTHTIGFNFSSQWLKDVAAAGGGQYKEATQAADLVAEVQDILTDVLKVNNTFVAPVAAINQFNRLNHRSEIYFAVFRPEETPGWPGNLKKYRIGGGSDAVIVDYSTDAGLPAIDPDTGFFSETAQSAWGGVTDGAEVDVGGANKKIPVYSDRKIYTHYAGSASTTLSNAANVLTSTNGNLTKAMFGVEAMNDTQFAEHIDWIRGKDTDDEDGNSVTNENRYIIGDPLHSKPVAVTYGGTEAEPDITVYFGSNSGFLHAVNSATGVEEFAFLPEDSMPKQATLREASTASKHVYGIDGSVTVWVNDEGNDGTITGGDGDFVRLFVGQRRGGSNYYALDVTDRSNPKLMWQIKGGTGDFAELGQSWARPVRGSIDLNGDVKDVLYISGGYDPDQDNTEIRAEDDSGRAIFIVDAVTGALIWKAGPTAGFTEQYADMKYSIPAQVAVVDITSSGLDNMFFVGDVGGQVWRFDIANGATDVADLITGGVIADLGVAGGTNVVGDNRRFYHSPDVGLVVDDDRQQKLAIAIGSGYQAHPLSTGTQDRFYMILDDNVYERPETYVKVLTENLYDATDNDVGEGVSGAEAELNAAKGYYINMPNLGEKVLSTPLIFNNAITFTTYEPNPTRDTSRCIPAAGVTRVYQIGLLEANPINDWDDVDGLTEDDRSTELKTTSIVDEPVIICSGGNCEIYVGPEQSPGELLTDDRIYKTFWRKE